MSLCHPVPRTRVKKIGQVSFDTSGMPFISMCTSLCCFVGLFLLCRSLLTHLACHLYRCARLFWHIPHACTVNLSLCSRQKSKRFTLRIQRGICSAACATWNMSNETYKAMWNMSKEDSRRECREGSAVQACAMCQKRPARAERGLQIRKVIVQEDLCRGWRVQCVKRHISKETCTCGKRPTNTKSKRPRGSKSRMESAMCQKSLTHFFWMGTAALYRVCSTGLR